MQPAASDPHADLSSPLLDAFGEVSEAVESGAGIPAVARAAAHALNASVIVVDGRAGVIAAACRSPEDERAVLAAEGATDIVALRVADAEVGRLHVRPHAGPPAPVLMRMVATLIAQEVDRAAAPDRASEAAVADFLADVVARRLTDRDNIAARAAELGADLSAGVCVLVVRAHPHHAEEGDWRARVATVAARGARGVDRTALCATVPLGPPRGEPELVLVVPAADPAAAAPAAEAVCAELESGLAGHGIVVAVSRVAADPADLHRATAEALLAANVAQARGEQRLAFEQTGAYRLLLPALSEDPGELRSFHEETVAPLVAYDQQYETELLHTLESFLDADGNVAKTAERLFTHRHTVRYRLDRVRELTGLDVASTDGRERLSLGLKAMRVLGVAPPGGPAHEAGAEGGRVAREGKDR